MGGLHLIDFEQLKINNVDLNEKIEERNDEILKLKKKVTSTVEVLTHVKEKLQFLQVKVGPALLASYMPCQFFSLKRQRMLKRKMNSEKLKPLWQR